MRIGERRSLALNGIVIAVTALGAGGYAWILDVASARVPDDLPLIMVAGAGATSVVLLWGRARATRAALIVALRAQLASVEQAHRSDLLLRQVEIAQARAEERSAIARDMHDGISHQLAIVAMHAGALEYRADLTAEQSRTAAGSVRRAAADSSVMLRDALIALRSADDVASTSPLPRSASLEALADSARRAGHHVDVVWVGTTVTELEQQPRHARACVRILEELFMNARKHAPGAPITVVVERYSKGLSLRVSNPFFVSPHTPPVGTGLGLVGVTERVQIMGGRSVLD